MNRSVRDEKLNDEDAQSIEDLERELFGALQPGSAQELTRTKISLPQAERQGG